MGKFAEASQIKSIQQAINRVKNHTYHKLCDLNMTIYRSKEPIPYEHRTEGEKLIVRAGDKWGDLFDCAWFHFTGVVPPEGEGQKLVYIIDINGEGLIFDDEGCPWRGITNKSSQFDRMQGCPGKRVVPYTECGKAGETASFWMDAGCNDLFGNYMEKGVIKEAVIASANERARTLFYDMTVLFNLMENTPDASPLRYEIYDKLIKIRDMLRDYSAAEMDACLAITGEQLARQNGDSSFSLTAFGHAHMDLAWLWPIRETKRKGARTFATALELMSRYPDYIFGASQPQLYQWTKEEYPALYEQIKEKAHQQRWELLGAMWVESDTNIPNGESLIRQMLYGNHYWQQEFGQTSRYAWLPDTFGYSGALPQILKKCGLDTFLTIKLSWNKFNAFPYANFKWKGIDGTSVLAHMPPEGNYLSSAAPRSLLVAQSGMARKGQYGEALLPYGIGDGGGGPSPCHLEYLQREKNLLGLPPVQQGFVNDFVERWSKKADGLPTWEGELYLECHLATYTTQGRSKKYNHDMEILLRDTEMLSALALRMTGHPYPQQQLEDIWKEVLLYQFHDILPGSSINRVYDESHARYAVLVQQTTALKEQAMAALANRIDTTAYTTPRVLFNNLSFPVTRWVKADSSYQHITLPPMGYTVVDMSAPASVEFLQFNGMENEYLKVTLSESGEITSLFHKPTGKELLSAPSNCLLFYEDFADAWEIEYDYRGKAPRQATLVKSCFMQDGPIQRVVQQYTYNKSSFELTLTLTQGSPRLEMHIKADWQEEFTMFRIQFNHAVVTDHVDCEIQFGHLSRSTRDNTTYEKAQYEVCAHNWIAARNHGLNFALLSPCKYGFYAKDQCLEMNCLRSSDHPGKKMEMGLQEFDYAVYADTNENGLLPTIRQGHDFSADILMVETDVHKGNLPGEHSFLTVEEPTVLVTGLKKAEQGDSLVLRSYEACGAGVNTRVQANFDTTEISICNMMEQNLQTISGPVPYHPFEIQTMHIR